MKREDLAKGQKVLITDINWHGRDHGGLDLHGQPVRDPDPGRILEVRRALAVIAVGSSGTDEKFWRAETYRIDTQHRNDQYGHQRFWLPEQWEDAKARRGLTEALRAAGVTVRPVSLGGEPRHTAWQLRKMLAIAAMPAEDARRAEEREADEVAVRKATGCDY